ncbi:radical SAM protein [Acidobacteria bacterium AH-259-O06]|nr:radical SAM protein [Acidobacteria bacterium AH-259-O06]
MAECTRPQDTGTSAPAFRLDVPLHELLTQPKERSAVSPAAQTQTLPDPVYPQRAKGDNELSKSEYHKLNALRTLNGWAIPYVKSRWYSKELRPIIPYLFTEWKCNLDCHYCWSFNNKIKGMTEDTARRSIDWLHSIGSRVLALMGGEPLLRPHFIHKVVYYAAKKGFFVYLPTNGRLMKPEVIDRLGDAGLATVNLAVDSVEERPELPKALNPIRSYFDYLVKRQHYYGYTVMFNINITRINMDDVKELTEIARANGIATDYHINEAPLTKQDHFKHYEDNSTYLWPEDYPRADAILDWIVDKQRQGYKMVNPVQHLLDMKDLMRDGVKPWKCRAGQNSLIIRTDGTLAPCFPMYSATYDWGTVGNHKFDVKQLDEMKKSCTKHCLSTCNYILSYCYDNMRVLKWGLKQALHGFRGATGSFE